MTWRFVGMESQEKSALHNCQTGSEFGDGTGISEEYASIATDGDGYGNGSSCFYCQSIDGDGSQWGNYSIDEQLIEYSDYENDGDGWGVN